MRICRYSVLWDSGALKACSDSTDGELQTALLSGEPLGVIWEHNIDPAKMVRWWLPIGRVSPRWACKVYICEKSHEILISNQCMVALRLSGRRGAEHSENERIPRTLWECQKGTSTLWLCCILQMHIPRVVWCSQHTSFYHTQLCALFLVFVPQEPLLCCTRWAVRWHKIMPWPLYALWNQLIVIQGNTRSCSRNGDYRLLPHFLTILPMDRIVQRSELKYGSTACDLVSVTCRPGRHE